MGEQGGIMVSFLAIMAAYLAGCAGWLLLRRARPALWPEAPAFRSDRPVLDLALALATGVAVMLVGEAYRRDWLLPSRTDAWGLVTYNINMLIVYVPLFVLLAIRRQPAATIYLSPNHAGAKVAIGVGLGFVAVSVYLLMMGSPSRLPSTIAGCVSARALGHFVPVFLEGAMIAMLFVRLRWVTGLLWALVILGVLFAAAHIPRQLESGLPPLEMVLSFALTSSVTVAVVYVLDRSRDVIWIGLMHYMMDVAIKAFEA